MNNDGPRSIEERLAMLADEPNIGTHRTRSWQRVRQALREPAPRPLWAMAFSAWRPLALASAVAVAAIAFVVLQPPRAVVAAVYGQVTAAVGGQVITLRAGDELPAGASIVTPADGWVALRIGDDRLSIDTGSRVTLEEISRFPARVVIGQQAGRSWHVPATDPQRAYVVRTDGGEAIARGTAFLVTSGGGKPSEVVTVEGTVQVEAATGSVLVSAGQSVRLTAAPPQVENTPTARLEASILGAVLRDALGRTCAEAQLPGCLRSGAGFTVLADVATELRIRVQMPGAGAVEVRGGDQRTEVTVPGQGTFEIKVSVHRSGTEVRVEVERDVEEVENDHETPRPSGTRTPSPSKTPERSTTPEPSRTPEASETPQRSRTPEPSRTPERSRTPEPSETPERSGTPEPSRTPERSATPSPIRSSETERPETPRPSPTASR